MTLACKTLALLSALILSTFALAEGTRTWEQSKLEELTKGTPNGKVYRIEETKAAPAKAGAKSSWSATPYFDPGSKYIWDIVLDHAGALYVATGDNGEIYKVSAKGQHSLFFKSDEVHIRVLALDPKGNLIAGSDGSGLVYRIAPNGEAFVLYSAPKKEITAIAIDPAGNIYVAGAGEKRPGSST